MTDDERAVRDQVATWLAASKVGGGGRCWD
jgi:hypothetical protein